MTIQERRRLLLVSMCLAGAAMIVACTGGPPTAEQQKKRQDLQAWIMAQDFAEDHIRGNFDTNPRSVQETGDGALMVSGDCTTADGVVHRIVAEMANVAGDQWQCRSLYIDAKQVR